MKILNFAIWQKHHNDKEFKTTQEKASKTWIFRVENTSQQNSKKITETHTQITQKINVQIQQQWQNVKTTKNVCVYSPESPLAHLIEDLLLETSKGILFGEGLFLGFDFPFWQTWPKNHHEIIVIN